MPRDRCLFSYLLPPDQVDAEEAFACKKPCGFRALTSPAREPPMQTIQQSIEQLHGALRDYIEATYHISARSLIDRRKALLDVPGVIHQVPYLESTPRYEMGERASPI